MKTDADIRLDLYHILKASPLSTAITGSIGYQGRDQGAKSEDCIISILTNENGEKQEAFVNVNIYVPNITASGRSVEDVRRTAFLATMAAEVLSGRVMDTFRFQLVSQRILPVNGMDQYVIHHKVRYTQLNLH